MSIDNTTYNFCIESLRYVHKIIGYKAIIEELNFIQHLHTPPKSQIISEHIANAMLGLDDMTEYDYDSESETEIEENNKNIVIETKNKKNKNIVIETKNNKNKYVRTEIPDENRCETTLPTGNRCTFKKTNNSVNCSRHTK